MAIYQRGKNYYADFIFHGQRVRRMIGPSRKGAGKVIAKWKAEIAENKFLDVRKDPAPINFYDFAKEYLEWSKANKTLSSFDKEIPRMRGLNKEFETKILQEITTWAIEKYKAKRKGEVKPASVNRELAILKHVFSKGVEWGKLKENPANRKVKFFKGAVNRVRLLMPDEFQSLLSNCDDFLKPIVTVAVHTGMRRGELLSLKWDQVNFEQGIITVLDTKNSERKDVPMDETVRTTLHGLERKTEFVFPSSKGKPFDPMTVHHAFHSALNRSGITDFRFHDLRHTFASNLGMAGVKIEKVQKLMGHKMIAMTQRYAHLTPGYLMDSVKLLDRVMAQNCPMSQNPPHTEKVVNLTR